MLVTVRNRIFLTPRFLGSALLFAAVLAVAPLYAQTQATPPAAAQTPVANQQPAAPATAPNEAQGQPGQEQGRPQSQGEPITTIKVQVNEVNLIFTVTDKKGRFITGLKRENFGLLDDGRPPEAVLGFTQQTNLPLRVGIMLDTSSSIRQRFQFE